jgi:dipeptidyl aminopeptidase/acylaminoacyl peptidase
MLPADVNALAEIGDPQFSADGKLIAYTVETSNAAEDKHETHIWVTPWKGGAPRQFTNAPGGSETSPRFSPDGKYLAFLASRQDPHGNDQIWLLPLGGGEPAKLTDLPGGVDDYVFAPDGKSIALIAKDPDPNDTGAKSPPKPIVIDRYKFKEDVEGLITNRYKRLYLFSLSARKPIRLTTGDYDEALPAFSPDGASIAFVSKREPEADRSYHFTLYRTAAKPGAKLIALTNDAGDNNDPEWQSRPAWSPDGSKIAYLQGGDVKLIEYATHLLAIVPATGGTPTLPAPKFDRNVTNPIWSPDGTTITLRAENDGAVDLIALNATTGEIHRLNPARQAISAFAEHAGDIAAVTTTLTQPAELVALDSSTSRPLTTHNTALLQQLDLAPVREINFNSPDGTEIHGFLTLPPGKAAAKNLPTILRLHGGPQLQFETEFRPDWQILASHGYAVIATNPRGSSGRGTAYSAAIYADWGHKDVQDVLAGVDYAVAQGIADPTRLGVGGWSYGGMLTNYTIVQDHRFKAAISGASIGNILAGYGTDEYVRDYETELGHPWDHLQTWEHVSLPFLHADRITTPTLFLGGDKDFNVPLQNSEQMYQALRSLGVPTELVIYPGQFHDMTRPSFLADRLTRYLNWYDKYLKNPKN